MTSRGTSSTLVAIGVRPHDVPRSVIRCGGRDDAVVEYVELARAATDRGEVVLRERRRTSGRVTATDVGIADADEPEPGVLELRVNGVFVMDSAETGSERALAATALSRVTSPRSVLVGGLGLGFTAREVLADPRVERLVVVEVEEALVGWMRDGTVPHGPALLADHRLGVVRDDVRRTVVGSPPASYDLVLLDVDNGPGFLVHDDNAAVYRGPFLSEVARVLRPGGVAAVWSMAESAPLAEAMRVLGGVEAVPVDVRLQGREETYWLYLGTTVSGREAAG
jgi:spermidine synthase